MDRLNQVMEIARSSNNVPAIVLFLTGLFVGRDHFKTRGADYQNVPGDNIPVTLIDDIRRR